MRSGTGSPRRPCSWRAPVVSSRPEPVRAARMVETSREQVRQGLDELRGAVSALREGAQGSPPLAEVLAALVDVYAQGAGAEVSLDLQPGLSEPEPDRKTVIIRTAQEALTNVQKHAAATKIEISLVSRDDAWVLTCCDNGRGLAGAREPTATGYGMGNLRARAAAFGGRVDLEQAPGGGAILRLTLPTRGTRDA